MATDELSLAQFDRADMVGLATDHFSHQRPYAAAAGLSQTISDGCARVCLRGFMTYNARRAIADFGFIEAYCRWAGLPGNDMWFEPFMDALENIESFLRKGRLFEENIEPEELSGFLYDLGFVRGSIWKDKIPFAISEALRDCLQYVTEHQAWSTVRPEPKEEMLSDHARDALLEAAGDGEDYFLLGLSGEVDASGSALARFTCQELGATNRAEADEWAEDSRRKWESETAGSRDVEAANAEPDGVGLQSSHQEPNNAVTDEKQAIEQQALSGEVRLHQWTPEKRAAAAERAKGQRKPPFDSDLESVKADFDAGMSPGAISRKWGCSDAHIRNFLTRHGIDPRRSKAAAVLTPIVPSAPVEAQPLADDDILEVQEMLDKDSSYEEIGEWFGCNAEAVRQFCQDKQLLPAKKLEEVRAKFAERQGVTGDAESDGTGHDAAELHGEADRQDQDDGLEEREEPIAPLAPAWDYDALATDDWGDIQQQLATGRSREQIASDYDVPVEALNGFIEDRLREGRERRAAKESPGKF